MYQKKKFNFFLCNFLVRTLWCFQKNFEKNFYPKKLKKRASKVAHNWPKPFFSQLSPQPTAHSQELIFHIINMSQDSSTEEVKTVRPLGHLLLSPKVSTENSGTI